MHPDRLLSHAQPDWLCFQRTFELAERLEAILVQDPVLRHIIRGYLQVSSFQ